MGKFPNFFYINNHSLLSLQYEHLIGSEEDFKVAKKAEVNSDRSFGMVSAASKKDRRTVEQVTMAKS